MKFSITLLILLLFQYNSSQSLKGFADYTKSTVKYNPEPNKINKLDPNIAEALGEAITGINELTYRLTFNDSIGKYEETKTLTSDSEKGLAKSMTAIFSGFFANYAFYSKKDKIILISKNVLDEDIIIKSSFDSFKWELSKEKLIINNLNCYKAKTVQFEEGRNGIKKIEVTAWYTPDINLPYGPDGFGGLPGLIIKLERDNIITTLKKIKFTDNIKKMEYPKIKKIMSGKEFSELMKKLNTNRN